MVILLVISNFQNAQASNTKMITSSNAPYFISIWSIDKNTLQRKEFLCNGFLIDSQFALTSSSCIKDFELIGGSYDHTNRNDRGYSYWIWGTRLIDPTIGGSKQTGMALIYAPLGVSPWNTNLKSNQAIPKIKNLEKKEYSLIHWNQSGNQYALQSSNVKILKGSKSQVTSLKNFQGSMSKIGVNSNSKNCENILGSPLISNNSDGSIEIVGMAIPKKTKCNYKLINFISISKFNSFIEELKKSMEEELITARFGETLKPILNSVLPSTSTDFLQSEVVNESRKSAIWIGYDPESGWADVWNMGFNVYSSFYEVKLGFRNSVDGCLLSKNGSVQLQISKNGTQEIHYSATATDLANCWTNGMSYYYKETSKSNTESDVYCDLRVTPYGLDNSIDVNSPIKYLNLAFNKGCLGIASKIWIRFKVTVNDEYLDTDIEPHTDGWYGPWAPNLFDLN